MSELLFDGMTVTVEIGFSTDGVANRIPFSPLYLTDIDWTDVTEHVRQVSTSRGRSSELDDYSTGSCQIVLDNRTRLFDPENTAGTYYGSLTPLRPVRIKATTGATTYDVFFGYIDQWPQSYINPNDAFVTVTASDGFKILNMTDLPSHWEIAIGEEKLRWFRMADFSGSFYVFDTANSSSTSAQWMSSAGAGVTSFCNPGPPLIVGESTTSSAFDGARFVQAVDPLGIDGVTPMFDQWTVEMWIQTTETETGNYAIWNHGDFIHGGSLGMVVAGGNATLVAQFGNRGSSNSMVTKNIQVTVNDGRPHHVYMTYRSNPSSGTVQELYVDGDNTAVSSGSFTDVVTQGYSFMTIGAPIYKSATASNNFTEYFRGSIQEVILYESVFDGSFGNIPLEHYEAGSGKRYQGDRTDLRIAYLLTFVQWPEGGSDLAQGQSTVLGLITTGKTALQGLKEMETAEQGRLFMSKNGQVKFVDRNALGAGNYVTVQAQFDDLGRNDVNHGIPYTDITFTYDDRYIFNDITVRQPSGNFAETEDSTSQQRYYKRTSTIDNVQVDNGYLLTNIAASRLTQYKDPEIRIDSLTVNGRAEPAKQGSILDLEIGDRVTVIRTPAVGTEIEKTLIIEGVKHSFTTDSWIVTFNTSPTNNAPFVLDSSLLGVLDTNVLGY